MFRKQRSQATGPVEYLVVGLGNPGKQYENTRHNAGFMAVDAIAQTLGIALNHIRFKGLCTDARIGERRVLLLKPSTYMNLSGESVREAMQFYKIPTERVIVIYDDISLDVGRVRIRRKGSDGGHNGIKSILYHTGADTFPRIKIGVGKKPCPEYDLAKWVLSRFTEKELEELQKVTGEVPEMVRLLVGGQTEEAMNAYNS